MPAPVSDQAPGDMSGKAQGGQTAQAWERAFEALTRAREAAIIALSLIQGLREEVNEEASESNLETLTERVGFALVDAAQAYEEGVEAIWDAKKLAQSPGSDTERPPPDQAQEDLPFHGCTQEKPASPLDSLWPETAPPAAN